MGNDRKFRDRALNTLWSRDLRKYYKSEAKKRSMTLEEYMREKEENNMPKKEEQATLKTETIEIKDIAPSDFELPKLDKVNGKIIHIKGFFFDVSNYGDYVVINTVNQGDFITTGEIVIKQLKRIAKTLSEQAKQLSEALTIKAKVEAREASEGKYYILK